MDPDALYGVKTTNYIAVGSIAVWVYDYILVLPHEIKLVWRSRCNNVKGLYGAARLLTLACLAITMYYSHSHDLSPKDCHIAFALSVFIGSISSFVCEAVMYIQVWIVCQQSIGIGAYLCLQFTAQIMICLILEGVFIRGMEYAEPTPPFKGCWPSSGQYGLIATIHAVSIPMWSILVLITFWTVYRRYRRWDSPLMSTLIRDGLIYMYGMVGFSIAGTITMYQAPRTLRWVWAIPTRVFGNILVSRLIIHLRRTASETADGNWGSLKVSESISEMPTFSEPPGLAEDEHTSHPDARPISRQDLVCQFPAYSKTSSGTQVTNGNGQRIV
ncbi:hypothetical protein CC2G_009819 [Coprinopsis cinerea AmutBmut pab1-1]|nr:hypothetical protein CC2G_009819 [Coprinopsis cinerea AmutBmut pab1-1]